MKKLAVLSMTFLFAMSLAQAQPAKVEKEKIKETKKELKSERVALRKLEGTVVSETAKNNFIVDFGNLQNVQWKRSGTFDEAAFTNKDGQKMKAFYDFDGKLVGTTQIKTFADVPVKGQQEIKKMYKDYTIGEVIFFDDNEANQTDMILWGTQFDDEDLYFVELSKGADKFIVKVNSTGVVTYFQKL